MKNFAIALIAVLTASVAVSQCSAPLDRSEKQAVVARAGDLLDEYYVFPDRAALAEARIAQALAAGDYDGIADPAAFAARLTADLQSVTHDRHMRVFARVGSPPPQRRMPIPIWISNSGFERADLLKGNIGYIKLRAFPPGPDFSTAADQAMAALSGTDALIIDLRDNSGGDPKDVAYLCGFFFDPRKPPVHINDIIWRRPGTDEFTTMPFQTEAVATPYLNKPVYLLTSRRTFSGGEEFAYDLKTQKRAAIFGEVTGGGANPGGAHEIDARFSIVIPAGRAENPVTKTNWEGVGVIPDVAVDEKQAFRDAMLDALGRLAAHGSDSRLMAVKAALDKGDGVDDLVQAHLLKFQNAPWSGGRENPGATILGGHPGHDQTSQGLVNLTSAPLAPLASLPVTPAAP